MHAARATGLFWHAGTPKQPWPLPTPLAAYRRRRRARRARLPVHHRPHHGPARRWWFQLLPGRDQAAAGQASGRRIGGGNWHARRASGRGGLCLCGGTAGRRTDRSWSDHLVLRADGELQGAAPGTAGRRATDQYIGEGGEVSAAGGGSLTCVFCLQRESHQRLAPFLLTREGGEIAAKWIWCNRSVEEQSALRYIFGLCIRSFVVCIDFRVIVNDLVRRSQQ